jgi:hypothetical protein
MNYKEFQEKQVKKVNSPLENKKSIKEKKLFNWKFFSKLSGIMGIIAVISMVIFFKNLPIIPGILCLITAILYYIQWKNGKEKLGLPIIWTINSILWFTQFFGF